MFFLRRYVEGIHQSGTTNVAEWEERPSILEFITECESQGQGKFVLFERGAGIRGMRKINEYVVKIPENSIPASESSPHDIKDSNSMSEMLVFAAEELGVEKDTILAVKKNMKMSDLSDDELVGVLDQITETDVSSAEDFETFKADLKGLMKEFRKRSTDMSLSEQLESEGKTNKALNFGAGFVVGGIGGVLATMQHYKGKMSSLEEKVMAMESSVKETENRLQEQSKEMEKQKRAEEAVRQFDNRMGLDSRFLSTFNNQNGPQHL